MSQADTTQALHITTQCYLKTLQAVAECLGQACPPVGGPSQHKIGRLRTRLAFDSSPAAIEQSCSVVAVELREYAGRASIYLERHASEVRRALARLEEITRTLGQRHDFYAAKLRHVAAQLPAASDPAESLLRSVESLSHETQSLALRMREELASVEKRIAESETTDPITGLMNRREMERRIGVQKQSGEPVNLLLFEVDGLAADEIAQQVAARLASQFRYNDSVCRWTDNEFLVLFQGPREIAEARLGQIVPWLAGRYLLTKGEAVAVTVKAALVESEAVLATN